MVQKISILALAALVSVMICPAQAADPATPAQVADDPASSESSIGESIGGFFKRLGKDLGNKIEKANESGGYSEEGVVARGWINKNLWVCKKDNPKPILVGNGRGVTVDPTILAAANTCDNLIKKGMLQRVAGAGAGARASGSQTAGNTDLEYLGCRNSESFNDGSHLYACYHIRTGKYLGWDDRSGDGPVFHKAGSKGDPMLRKGGSRGVTSSGHDPQAFDKIQRDAAKEIARIDKEGRENDAKSQAMFSREAAKQQKAGTQELQVELKKQLDEIQRTGEENLRKAKAKGLAPN